MRKTLKMAATGVFWLGLLLGSAYMDGCGDSGRNFHDGWNRVAGFVIVWVAVLGICLAGIAFMTVRERWQVRSTLRRIARDGMERFPSGRWALPAPESYVLLRGPTGEADAFKLGLLQLLAQGALKANEEVVPGQKKMVNVFRPPETPTSPLPAGPVKAGREYRRLFGTFPQATERYIVYRDVKLRSEAEGGQSIASLQKDERVTIRSRRDDLGMAEVETEAGRRGWVKLVELDFPPLNAPWKAEVNG